MADCIAAAAEHAQARMDAVPRDSFGEIYTATAYEAKFGRSRENDMRAVLQCVQMEGIQSLGGFVAYLNARNKSVPLMERFIGAFRALSVCWPELTLINPLPLMSAAEPVEHRDFCDGEGFPESTSGTITWTTAPTPDPSEIRDWLRTGQRASQRALSAPPAPLPAPRKVLPHWSQQATATAPPAASPAAPHAWERRK